MQIGKASGLQIAFFTFAVCLLTVPAAQYVGRKLQLSPEWIHLSARVGQFVLLAFALLVVERVRPGLIAGFLSPVPHDRRFEVATVSLLKVFFPFAIFGGMMVWHWNAGGPLSVEQRFPTAAIHTADQAYAFAAVGLTVTFFAATLGPVVEEIVFRGLLYSAWERAWGWIPSMILTSAVFGIWHLNFLSAFLSSIVFVCVYRRTGTLVAPIIVHAITNAMVWYPLAGQFYIPSPELTPGDLTTWRLHLAMLTLSVVALPIYVFMARHAYARAEP